jgi:AcrR family transcriptional regulator
MPNKSSNNVTPIASSEKKSAVTEASETIGVEFTFPNALAAAPLPTAARDRILHAAVGILNEEGFGALTQTRVAEKAGVRQSHITYYFPARNDLLRETAAYGCNVMLEMLSGSIAAGTLTLDTARDFFVADISDRRFARLMCALIVASDEDEHIKPWLASFEELNHKRLLDTFQTLGLSITLEDVEYFHSSYVGAVMLDLGESTEASFARADRVLRRAFEALMAKGLSKKNLQKPLPTKKR